MNPVLQPIMSSSSDSICTYSPLVFILHSNASLFSLISVSMPTRHEPKNYQYLLSIPEFCVCCELFLQEGWGKFLYRFQGHDDEISLIFSKGFDGNMAHVGSLVFPITEDSIVVAMKLPRKGARWHKYLSLPLSKFNLSFNKDYHHVAGTRGFH